MLRIVFVIVVGFYDRVEEKCEYSVGFFRSCIHADTGVLIHDS